MVNVSYSRWLTRNEIKRIEALKEKAKTDESVLNELTADEIARYARYQTDRKKRIRLKFIQEHGDPRVSRSFPMPDSSPRRGTARRSMVLDSVNKNEGVIEEE